MFSKEDEDKVTIKVGKVEKQLTLTLAQKAILNSQDPFVTIQGPPGTGKTTVLMRKGLQWLQAGNDVVVLSLHISSLAPSRLIYLYLSEERKVHQGPMTPETGGNIESPDPMGLVMDILSGRSEPRTILYFKPHAVLMEERKARLMRSAPPDGKAWGKVNFEFIPVHDNNIFWLGLTLDLLKKHGDRDLHVIMDNQTTDDDVSVMMQLEIIKAMKGGIPGLHLWTTDGLPVHPQNAATVHVLNRPLRYPAPVLQEVLVVVEINKKMGLIPEAHSYDYHPDIAFYPGVIHTRHRKRKWPINSKTCGRMVANILREIGVGQAAATAHSGAEGGTTEGGHHRRYQYRDVLVLCRNIVEVRTPPSFVVGLEACGIPTKIVGSDSGAKLIEAIDVAILANEDKVIVANCQVLPGLDRKVVVCLIGAHKEDENWQKHNKEEMDIIHRQYIYSQCSEQLIVVHMPEGMEGGPRKCSVL